MYNKQTLLHEMKKKTTEMRKRKKPRLTAIQCFRVLELILSVFSLDIVRLFSRYLFYIHILESRQVRLLWVLFKYTSLHYYIVPRTKDPPFLSDKTISLLLFEWQKSLIIGLFYWLFLVDGFILSAFVVVSLPPLVPSYL